MKSLFRKKTKNTSRVYEAVLSNLDYLSQDSPFLRDALDISSSESTEKSIAKFHRDEIQVGNLLHEGQFSHSVCHIV